MDVRTYPHNKNYFAVVFYHFHYSSSLLTAVRSISGRKWKNAEQIRIISDKQHLIQKKIITSFFLPIRTSKGDYRLCL